jgi:hypothetical protein
MLGSGAPSRKHWYASSRRSDAARWDLGEAAYPISRLNGTVRGGLSLRGEIMPARTDRLAEFETAADPPPDTLVQLLCEDHVGTFLLPFLCRSTPDGFKNDRTGESIESDVVGWREPKGGSSR